jgi:crotonobetainyl-CoA:carnitine CoA-transferase CaiB-like acyl-CoA transferase
LQELEVKGDRRELERIFETRTAEQWEEWATERDLPLAAVRHLGHDEDNETAFVWEGRQPPTRGEDKP